MTAAIIDYNALQVIKSLESPKKNLLKQFILVGRAVPKKRPRVTNRGIAYMPKNYSISQNQLIAQFEKQKSSKWEPLSYCFLEVDLIGGFRGDLDNIVGAYLDAMVKAKVIVDDRLSVVKSLSVQHFSGLLKTPTAVVRILV